MARLNSLKPLLVVTPAFVLAGLGQLGLTEPLRIAGWTVNGWLLFAAAALLFVLASRRVAVAQFALGRWDVEPAASPATKPVLLRASWGLLILACIVMGVSFVLFGAAETVPAAWNWHIASVLLLIGAFIPFDKLRRPAWPSGARPTAWLWRALPVVAVLALATLARLWQLGEFPFGNWADEATNGLTAVQILQDPRFRPVFTNAAEMPSHFNYLIALSFSLFGVSVTALRLVTAGFGVAGVLFAYLLFRRWFGEGMGLVAACVLAVMRYDLTFSRIGMQPIATPAFELAAIYFLGRGLLGRKLSDFAWLGLTVGFGLAFYTAFRLFPVILLIFLVYLFVIKLAKYGGSCTVRQYGRQMWQHWLVACLALLIALAPVAQFALRDRKTFFARQGTVSLLQRRDEPNLAKAYWNNLGKHLLMFNVQGDRNGRHNLPSAPMLDPVMGALFILGLAFALWRWRDPPNFLMILLFIVMLHGGILSLDFEAPQSLRSIGVIPALVYFITLPLAVVAGMLRPILYADAGTRQWRPAWISGYRIWSLGIVLVLVAVTYLNLNMFFNKQQQDPSAWAQHSTAETIAANEMNRLRESYDFLVSAVYFDTPTVRFLAGNITNRQRWTVTDRLPLVRQDTGRGVVMMFDEKLMQAYEDVKRFYPGASFVERRAPAGGGPVLWEAILKPEDLRAVSGIVARYFPGHGVEGGPAKEEVRQQIAVDWTKTTPLAGPSTAELRGTLFAQQYGDYRFSLRGAPGASFWVDEMPVSDAPLTLARGNHALRLQIPGSASKVELWWQPPVAPLAQIVPAANLFRPTVANSGLLGAYYPSPDWSGPPAFTQIDPEIAFYFHVIPLPRPYSVEWTGKLFAPEAGAYRFALDSVDGSRLTLDDHVVVDNPDGHTTIEGETTLERGWHDIDVRFSDKTGGTRIYLYWTPPGENGRQLVPSRYLSPPMGRYSDPNKTDR